jgi:hypothetical protein
MKQQLLSDFDKWKASVSYGHRWIIAERIYYILSYQENVWRVRQGQALLLLLSEHGKGNDVLESVAVQHVCWHKTVAYMAALATGYPIMQQSIAANLFIRPPRRIS